MGGGLYVSVTWVGASENCETRRTKMHTLNGIMTKRYTQNGTKTYTMWEYPPPDPPITSTVLNNRKATIGANWVWARKRAANLRKLFKFYVFYEMHLTITPQGRGGGATNIFWRGSENVFLVQTLSHTTDAELIDP